MPAMMPARSRAEAGRAGADQRDAGRGHRDDADQRQVLIVIGDDDVLADADVGEAHDREPRAAEGEPGEQRR